MSKITYIPNRVIDADGISDGASIYVYQSGTSTLVDLFDDSDFTTPISNPIVVPAGAAVPDIFTDESGLLRVRVVADGGAVIQDSDPYNVPVFSDTLAGDDGAALVGFQLARSNSVLRTAEAKLSEGRVSVADFIPTSIWTGMLAGTEANVVTYINNAIATLVPGDTLYFPGGVNYLVNATSGEISMNPLPEYTNVFMEQSAWIYLNTADPTITAFIPSGNNILTVNVDGRSLPENSSPDAGDWTGVNQGNWLNASHGVRAYGDAALQIGSTDVTIVDSKFRNLRYAIQTEGAIAWHIIANRFERTKFSAILMGCSNGYPCLANLISSNLFENTGDYACAFYEVAGNTTGESAFNTIIGNNASSCNLVPNSDGHAFGWENGQVALQHHNLIANNVYDRQRSDRTYCRGVAVMNTNSYSTVVGNIAKGNMGGTVNNEAITCQRSKHCLIANNNVSDYSVGIDTEGSEDIVVTGNNVVDCGKTGGGAGIVLARTYGCRGVLVTNNVITTTTANTNYAASVAAISCLGSASTDVIDVTIKSNMIDRPLDIGIIVSGDPSRPPTNINVIDNDIVARESADPASTFFESYPVAIRYSKSVNIARNRIKDAKLGIFARDNVELTLRDNELFGTQASAFGLWCTGSSKINSDGNIVRVIVTSMLNGDTPRSLQLASGTTIYFGINDAFWPMTDSTDNADALADGNATGMFYHTAGAMKRVI